MAGGSNASAARRTPLTTRARIMASAERLFAAEGFSGVTMPRIAAASGITAGAIYKHFDSKAALFFEVVARSVKAAVVSAAPANPPGGSPIPAIVAGHTGRGGKRLRQMAVEMHHASARHPDVRRLLRQALDRQIDEMRGAILAGQQDGELDPSLDAELAANAVMAFIMGLMHMETLAPQLVGDARWRDFVRDRVEALMGAGPIRSP